MPPDRVTRQQMDYCMQQIGYVHIEAGIGVAEGFVYYDDGVSNPLEIDFSRGYLPWYYLEFCLENAGVNIDAFCAALESA